MNKTPEQLAEEYANNYETGDQAWGGAYGGFLAGYQAAKDSACIDTNSIDTGTKMQWISVKDKLPEDRDIVAVWTNAGDIHAAWRKDGAWLMFNPCCTYESELKGVSHWHEIADTPEEGI